MWVSEIQHVIFIYIRKIIERAYRIYMYIVRIFKWQCNKFYNITGRKALGILYRKTRYT